jgi:hypothetical protein
MRLITLPRMAQVLGNADNLDANGTAALHNRLHNLARKGFLKPNADANTTATSARLFEMKELARGRILADAIQGGLDGEALASVAEALNAPHVMRGMTHPPSAKVPGGFNYSDGLSNALRGLAAQERWLVRIMGRIQQNGKTDWISNVLWDGYGPISPRARDTLNRHSLIFFSAELKFDSRLVRCLI